MTKFIDVNGKETIYLTDRSAAETDDICGMKFWLNRHEGGIGIVPKDEPLALLVGRETHVDLATVAEMEDITPGAIQELIDDLLRGLTEEDKKEQKKMEVLYRRLGWMAANALYIEPATRAEYKNIHTEHEIILDRDPLWVAVTPDRVLEHRTTGLVHYREYKSTISAATKWVQSWPYAIQIHIGLKALQEELKVPIKFAQVMGLMKGYESTTDHRLMHPYVWGYYNSLNHMWTHEYEKARGNDWKPMPVWEYPGGVVNWVQACGRQVALNQFPQSPPVFLNDRMLEDWVTRRLHREREVRTVKESCVTQHDLRGMYFPRRTRSCRPPFGDACPYLLACWSATAEADPLSTGEYVKRIPHHEVEIRNLEDL